MKKVLFLLLVTTFLFGREKEIKWKTFFESSNYLSTPSYTETIEYFSRLQKVSPFAKMIKIGETPQGRALFCFVASKNKAFTPGMAKKSGKPILLIQNGIHSGEIEGKDACMLLLREILVTKEKSKLLDDIILMIIPVFNADGHERKSPYNRINQNGPTEMGWRTTAQNYNLNRDYMKADSPEMQAWLKLFSSWLPDMLIDSHTTDGADYQYSITYGLEKDRNLPPLTQKWIRKEFIPFIKDETEKSGFLVAPYVTFKEDNWRKGISDWASPPRFSHGYTAVQNRPGLLIETHMLKPYKERVFATKAMIESVIKLMQKNKDQILEINKKADEYALEFYAKNRNDYPLSFVLTDQSVKMKYKGIEGKEEDSWITGTKIIRYTGKPFEEEIPYYDICQVKDSVRIPKAYLIPREYKLITERMKLHGIKVEEIKSDKKFIVEKYKFRNIKFGQQLYEGHFQPAYEFEKFKDTVVIPAGSFYISTNQRTIGIIVHLLEPLGQDSFVKWGFFNSIFEQKEYYEEYAMEPIAEKMMRQNPKLKEEFLKKLESDSKMKESSRRRLDFFYERSPYFDKQLNVYPVLSVIE